MPAPVRWGDQAGVTLIEVMVYVMVLAISIPGIMGWIALSQWSDAEARAQMQAYVTAQSRIEWLQANCKDKLASLMQSTYNPALPTSCATDPVNYPKDTWLEITDLGIPGFQYRVEVEHAPGQESNDNLAMVTVRVKWNRAFLMRALGQRNLVGYLSGSSQNYWEFYDTWSL